MHTQNSIARPQTHGYKHAHTHSRTRTYAYSFERQMTKIHFDNSAESVCVCVCVGVCVRGSLRIAALFVALFQISPEINSYSPTTYGYKNLSSVNL